MDTYNTEYQIRGKATKASRRKAGLYPTKKELAAARKATYRGGDANLTVEDVVLLSNCKWLAASLREKYRQMSESMSQGQA